MLTKRSNLMAALTIALSGCAITQPVTYAPPPVAPDAQNLGSVDGRACDFSILFFLPFFGDNEASLDRAVHDAMQKRGANALINTTIDYQYQFFFLVNRRCTLVHGEAIRNPGRS